MARKIAEPNGLCGHVIFYRGLAWAQQTQSVGLSDNLIYGRGNTSWAEFLYSSIYVGSSCQIIKRKFTVQSRGYCGLLFPLGIHLFSRPRSPPSHSPS